jgi:4-diphosphocytidyl-2-C-methyl-D-erythritol kinase
MCDTGAIFRTYRDKFYKEVSIEEQNKLFAMKSKDIYNTYTIEKANDLYESALYLEKDLNTKALNLNTKSFFSGSGSSFFTIG